jgi:hypothetical protein
MTPKEVNTVHRDTPEAASFPQPPLFFWLPIDGRRHKAKIQDQHLPPPAH